MSAARLCLALAACAAVVLWPASGSAQRVTGRVLDASSRAPVADARVTLIDTQGTSRSAVVTDSTGAFVLPIPAGRYAVHVERLGYETYRSAVLEVGAGESVAVEIQLGIGAVPLEPLRVTGRSALPRGRAAEFYRRRDDPARAGGHFLSREDLDLNPVTRTTTVLTRVPAVTLLPVARSPNETERYLILLRGGGNMGGTCAPALYIDGVRVQQNEMSTVDEFLDPWQLEGVEVYRAAVAPAEYRGGNDCGVVAFWTRVAEQGGDWSWKRLTLGFGGLGVLLVLLFR